MKQYTQEQLDTLNVFQYKLEDRTTDQFFSLVEDISNKEEVEAIKKEFNCSVEADMKKKLFLLARVIPFILDYPHDYSIDVISQRVSVCIFKHGTLALTMSSPVRVNYVYALKSYEGMVSSGGHMNLTRHIGNTANINKILEFADGK